MGGDRRRPFIAIPEIEESGAYEATLYNGDVVLFNVVIERQWIGDENPTNDVCTHEYIRVIIDGVYNMTGCVNYDYDKIEQEIDKTIIRYKV